MQGSPVDVIDKGEAADKIPIFLEEKLAFA
jgi:hypothetical protein